MSARERLICMLAFGARDAAAADTALDAYRAEVLREAAEMIRRDWAHVRGSTSAKKVLAFAADLIDPTAPGRP